MIALIAKLRVKPDKILLYENVCKDLIATVRAREPGTIYYEQFKAAEEPNTYTIIEVYGDKEAQATHAESAYFKSAFEKILTYVEGEIEVKFYETLSAAT